MSKDSEIKKVDDEMKAKAAGSKVSSVFKEVTPEASKPAAETSKPAAETSKPAADASKTAASESEKPETKPEKPETKSKPEKSERILISKEEYENARTLIRINNDLADKLGRMSGVIEGLSKQVASLGGKIGELERQIDAKIEKPVLVYRATFADGEEIVSDKETDIYAKSMLPKRLVQVYAWKRGKEFKLLDDDELESLGLKKP